MFSKYIYVNIICHFVIYFTKMLAADASLFLSVNRIIVPFFQETAILFIPVSVVAN